VGNAEDAHARIALGCAKGIELFQEDALEAGLLTEYSGCGGLKAFVHPDEAAWQGPLQTEWVLLSLNQERVEAALSRGQQYHIYRHRRALKQRRVVAIQEGLFVMGGVRCCFAHGLIGKWHHSLDPKGHVVKRAEPRTPKHKTTNTYFNYLVLKIGLMIFLRPEYGDLYISSAYLPESVRFGALNHVQGLLCHQ
jgi:hypothetical protein